MDKKLFSILLSLILCLSLAVHADAVTDQTTSIHHAIVPSNEFPEFIRMANYYNTQMDYYATGNHDQNFQAINWPLCIGIGIAVAAVVLLVLCSSMNTKHMQYGASEYIKTGTFHLRERQDLFLYSSVSKVRRQQNNSASSASRRNGR